MGNHYEQMDTQNLHKEQIDFQIRLFRCTFVSIFHSLINCFSRLQPLLVEIRNNKATVAMCHLDYVNPKTFKYSHEKDYRTRYGFDWQLHFFETYFRKDQTEGKDETVSLP